MAKDTANNEFGFSPIALRTDINLLLLNNNNKKILIFSSLYIVQTVLEYSFDNLANVDMIALHNYCRVFS